MLNSSIAEARRRASNFRGISVGDVLTFLTVTEYESLRTAADTLQVSPSQVSKSLHRLEQNLQLPLLTRSGRRVAISDVGRQATTYLEQALLALRRLQEAVGNAKPVLTVAGPSYLLGSGLGTIAASLPESQLRGVSV